MTCIRCGGLSDAQLLCDKCMKEVLKSEEARRRRMSIVFTLIIILGIATYYIVL